MVAQTKVPFLGCRGGEKWFKEGDRTGLLADCKDERKEGVKDDTFLAGSMERMVVYHQDSGILVCKRFGHSEFEECDCQNNGCPKMPTS